MGHVLMENRNGLAPGATLTHATGVAEREAAPAFFAGSRRLTLAAHKACAVTAPVEDRPGRK